MTNDSRSINCAERTSWTRCSSGDQEVVLGRCGECGNVYACCPDCGDRIRAEPTHAADCGCELQLHMVDDGRAVVLQRLHGDPTTYRLEKLR